MLTEFVLLDQNDTKSTVIVTEHDDYTIGDDLVITMTNHKYRSKFDGTVTAIMFPNETVTINRKEKVYFDNVRRVIARGVLQVFAKPY